MTREEFTKLATAKYDKINELKKEPTLLDYEQGFVELWNELGREVAQANLGDQGKDSRKKRKSSSPSEK